MMLLFDNETDARKIKNNLIRYKDAYDYNSSLIFGNLLQYRFYTNSEKIKQSLPPQIKRLIVVSRWPETRTEQEINEGKEVAEGIKKEYIVYDSNRTLEEIYIEEPWLYGGESYKIN